MQDPSGLLTRGLLVEEMWILAALSQKWHFWHITSPEGSVFPSSVIDVIHSGGGAFLFRHIGTSRVTWGHMNDQGVHILYAQCVPPHLMGSTSESLFFPQIKQASPDHGFSQID